MNNSPLLAPEFMTIREAYNFVQQNHLFIETEKPVLELLSGVAPVHKERAKQFLFCVLHGLDPSQIFVIETGRLKCYLISYASRVIEVLRLQIPKYYT